MSDSFTSALSQARSILEYAHIHMVGIKGVAMTSLALCLDDAGIRVTGSDVPDAFVTQDVLTQRGFHLFEEFSIDHISSDIDLVVYTGAHQGKNNIEVVRALELGIPVMSHAEALGSLMSGKKVISVCGTGGKSTTSAMIAWVLECAGLHPNFAVGVGNVPNFGVPGRFVRDSQWFVAEADEYAVDPTADTRPRFIFQEPDVIVCTSLSYDHPDIYPDFESMKRVFSTFFTTAKESVYVNGDAGDLYDLFKDLRERDDIPFESCSVGFDEHNDYHVTSQTSTGKENKFHVSYAGAAERQPQVSIAPWQGKLIVPGKHNISNAVLAMLVAVNDAGVATDVALDALSKFTSTMRRFEYKGTLNGAPCYDDYAHTPSEIKMTLAALKQWETDKRVVAVFQPHTFSRTKALFSGFATAFEQADVVYILDIFASARESDTHEVTSRDLVEAIQATGATVQLVPTITDLAVLLPQKLSATDTLVTMGAGDIYSVFSHLDLT